MSIKVPIKKRKTQNLLSATINEEHRKRRHPSYIVDVTELMGGSNLSRL